MLFSVGATLLLMGASISGSAGAETIVAPLPSSSSLLRRGLQDEAELPDQTVPTSEEDALLLDLDQQTPPSLDSPEIIEEGVEIEYDESLVESPPVIEEGVEIEYDESLVESPPVEEIPEGEYYDDVDNEENTEGIPSDPVEDPLAEVVPPPEDSNSEYDLEVEYDESLPVESPPVEEYTEGEYDYTAGEYDDVDNEATTEEVPLDVEAPQLEESPSDQEYYSQPEEPLEEGYDDLDNGDFDEEISPLEQEYQEEEEQLEFDETYNEAPEDEETVEEYTGDYIDDIYLDEDQNEEYNDVGEYNYDEEGDEEENTTITAAEQGVEDLVNKRNVWIASIVVGCAMLALMLFVADQLIQYPDGLCTKFCRYTLDCVRTISCCHGNKRIAAGEREGRDKLSGDGFDKSKHSLPHIEYA